MIKNLKNTIFAIIIGIIITSSVFAVPQIKEYIFTKSPCKLLIDGKEYSNPDMPQYLFMKDGRNYVPIQVFKELCIKLNVGFEYDNITKEIKINTSTTSSTNLPNKSIAFTPTKLDNDNIDFGGIKGIMYATYFYASSEEIKNNPINSNLEIEFKDNIYYVKNTKTNEIIILNNKLFKTSYGYINYKGKDYLNISSLEKFIPYSELDKIEARKLLDNQSNNNTPSESIIEKLKETPDKLPVEYISSKPYVLLCNIEGKYSPYFKFTYTGIIFDEELSKLPSLIQTTYDKNQSHIEKTVLEDIPVVASSLGNKLKYVAVDYDYYIKNILPLISKAISNKIEKTPDGIPVEYYLNENYVKTSFIERKYTPKSCKFIKKQNNTYDLLAEGKILIPNVSLIEDDVHGNRISYEYYLEKILPLLQ